MSIWSQLEGYKSTRPTQRHIPRGAGQRVRFKPGDAVGEWTLLQYMPGSWPAPHDKNERIPPRWLCRCSCGVERDVKSDNLTTGRSRSCGHASGGRHA